MNKNIERLNMKKINCFVPYAEEAQVESTVKSLQATGLVNKIYLLGTEDKANAPMTACHSMQVRLLKV